MENLYSKNKWGKIAMPGMVSTVFYCTVLTMAFKEFPCLIHPDTTN